MNETDLSLSVINALEANLRNKIDTQVILQILIKNNMTTLKEIADLREKVTEANGWDKSLQILNRTRESIEKDKVFEDGLRKALSGQKLNKYEKQSALDYLNENFPGIAKD